MDETRFEQAVSKIELHLRPSFVEKARVSHVITFSEIAPACLEYLVIEIDLDQDVVTTYFFQDDDAIMLEKQSLVDALLAIMEAFSRNPFRVLVFDRDGRIVESTAKNETVMSKLLFLSV